MVGPPAAADLETVRDYVSKNWTDVHTVLWASKSAARCAVPCGFHDIDDARQAVMGIALFDRNC